MANFNLIKSTKTKINININSADNITNNTDFSIRGQNQSNRLFMQINFAGGNFNLGLLPRGSFFRYGKDFEITNNFTKRVDVNFSSSIQSAGFLAISPVPTRLEFQNAYVFVLKIGEDVFIQSNIRAFFSIPINAKLSILFANTRNLSLTNDLNVDVSLFEEAYLFNNLAFNLGEIDATGKRNIHIEYSAIANSREFDIFVYLSLNGDGSSVIINLPNPVSSLEISSRINHLLPRGVTRGDLIYQILPNGTPTILASGFSANFTKTPRGSDDIGFSGSLSVKFTLGSPDLSKQRIITDAGDILNITNDSASEYNLTNSTTENVKLKTLFDNTLDLILNGVSNTLTKSNSIILPAGVKTGGVVAEVVTLARKNLDVNTNIALNTISNIKDGRSRVYNRIIITWEEVKNESIQVEIEDTGTFQTEIREFSNRRSFVFENKQSVLLYGTKTLKYDKLGKAIQNFSTIQRIGKILLDRYSIARRELDLQLSLEIAVDLKLYQKITLKFDSVLENGDYAFRIGRAKIPFKINKDLSSIPSDFINGEYRILSISHIIKNRTSKINIQEIV